MDQYMNWENRIDHVIKKISRALGVIRLAQNVLPLTTFQTLYKSIVEPYFRFCCPFWGSCGVNVLGKLHARQNRAARIARLESLFPARGRFFLQSNLHA